MMVRNNWLVCLAVAGLVLGGCGTEDGDDDGGGTGMPTGGGDDGATGDDGDDGAGTAATAGDDGDGDDDGMATAGDDDGVDDGMATTAGDGMDDGMDESTDGGATCDPPCEAGQECVAGMCIGGKGGMCEAGTCGDCDDQAMCVMCAQGPGAECADLNMACNANAECGALIQCVNACGADMACAQGCLEKHPDGTADFQALIQCLQQVCA